MSDVIIRKVKFAESAMSEEGVDEVAEDPNEGCTVAVPTQMQLLSTWEVRRVPHNCVTRYGRRRAVAWGALYEICLFQVMHFDGDPASGSSEPRTKPPIPGAGCLHEDPSPFSTLQ